jgi:hypothetical protein
MEEEPIYQGIVWDLYREHIKKFSHAKVRGEPSDVEMKEAFQEMLPETLVTVLVQEKVGMVVQFHHVVTFPSQEVIGVSDIKAFLSARYGGGKFKLNLYRGIHFLSTKNFETTGLPLWKEFVQKSNASQS